jgi:hypothetical protein
MEVMKTQSVEWAVFGRPSFYIGDQALCRSEMAPTTPTAGRNKRRCSFETHARHRLSRNETLGHGSETPTPTTPIDPRSEPQNPENPKKISP